MNRLEGIIATLDYLLSTKRKKHIIGGVLMSMSLLFAGLAVTVTTLKQAEEERSEEDEQYIE